MLHAMSLLVGSLLGVGNPESAADVVTLRDRRALLCQVLEAPPRGKVVVLVRRAWVDKNLPDLARRWRATEAPTLKRARDQRLARLEAWRRERNKIAAKDDVVGDWLDKEIDRLKQPNNAPDASRLMAVSLNRTEISGMTRRPAATSRLLRLGWRINGDAVESQPVEDLKATLEGRGFDPNSATPAVIDDLLPIPLETDAHWKLRRAATEIANEPALRFIRHGPLVLAENATTNDAGMGLDALGGIVKSLLGDEPPVDPLAAKLSQIARTGRTGALVTRLDISAENGSIRIETTLWVRSGGDQWGPAVSRASNVRIDEAKPDEANVVGADPQVKAILGVVESLGLGDLGPTLKNAGAATKSAMGSARTEFQKDLDTLVLPVTTGP
jgi:hypothetical protein